MASYIALDIGEKRIGVALADQAAPFPAPLTTLEATEDVATQFASILRQHNVVTVVIGLPRNQQGEETAQTERVKYIAQLLNIPKHIPIAWQDESLTSVKAEAELKKRKKPHTKADIDALAATYILEDFIANNAHYHQTISQHTKKAPATVADKPKKKKLSPKRTKSLWRQALIAIGAAAIATIVASLAWYAHALSPRTAEQSYAVVTITNGSTTGQIATTLENHGVIRSAFAFRIYAKVHSVTTLQAGDYRLSSNQAVPAIIKTIANGDVTSVNVTIPPGLRQDQIIALLQKDGYSKQALEAGLEKVRSQELLKGLPASTQLEGYLFPDTYKISPETTPAELFTTMLNNFQTKVTPQIKQGVAEQGLTLHQAVILASIIQKEASDATIQPTIAQVFLKRFKEGVPLGSDVTYKYAAAQFGAPDSPDSNSPYNTRKVTGLPPTPIANFNLSALQAVAAPAGTDYNYFVAGDDGIIHFSRTLEEHQSFIQKYCHKLCQ